MKYFAKIVDFFSQTMLSSAFGWLLSEKAFGPHKFNKDIVSTKGFFHPFLFPTIWGIRAVDVSIAWVDFLNAPNKNLDGLANVLAKTTMGVVEGLAIFVFKVLAPYFFLAAAGFGTLVSLFNAGKHYYQASVCEKGSEKQKQHKQMARNHLIGAAIAGGFTIGIGLLLAFPVSKVATLALTGGIVIVSAVTSISLAIKNGISHWQNLKKEKATSQTFEKLELNNDKQQLINGQNYFNERYQVNNNQNKNSCSTKNTTTTLSNELTQKIELLRQQINKSVFNIEKAKRTEKIDQLNVAIKLLDDSHKYNNMKDEAKSKYLTELYDLEKNTKNGHHINQSFFKCESTTAEYLKRTIKEINNHIPSAA